MIILFSNCSTWVPTKSILEYSIEVSGIDTRARYPSTSRIDTRFPKFSTCNRVSIPYLSTRSTRVRALISITTRVTGRVPLSIMAPCGRLHDEDLEVHVPQPRRPPLPKFRVNSATTGPCHHGDAMHATPEAGGRGVALHVLRSAGARLLGDLHGQGPVLPRGWKDADARQQLRQRLRMQAPGLPPLCAHPDTKGKIRRSFRFVFTLSSVVLP